jgi:hypothetical protein
MVLGMVALGAVDGDDHQPQRSAVSYRRWTLHLGSFVAGVAGGAVLTYAVVHTLYRLLGLVSPAVWLLIALPVVTRAGAPPRTRAASALHDLRVKAAVFYPVAR